MDDAGGGIGFPGVTVRQRVTVVDLVSEPGRHGRAVVEAGRWVCVNAHWFAGEPFGVARALIEGKLRYQLEPHRWTVPVRDVVGLVPDLPAAPARPARAARHLGVAS
jgi:hypothetical protein